MKKQKKLGGRRKLSFGDAQRLRKMYATGKYSHRDLGDKFKIHRRTVYSIINKITYKTK